MDTQTSGNIRLNSFKIRAPSLHHVYCQIKTAAIVGLAGHCKSTEKEVAQEEKKILQEGNFFIYV